MCKKTEKVQRPAGELGLVCKKTEKEFKKKGTSERKHASLVTIYTHIYNTPHTAHRAQHTAHAAHTTHN